MTSGGAQVSMEEAKAAMKAVKSELAATQTAFDDAQNAKLALQARLKAAEVPPCSASAPGLASHGRGTAPAT